MPSTAKSVVKRNKPRRPKVEVRRVEILRPKAPPKEINFIGWAKKGKDASCT